MASVSKVFCADLGYRVCEQALAIMGDEGMLCSRGAEKNLRDIRLNQIYEGTNQINRLAIIEEFWETEFGKSWSPKPKRDRDEPARLAACRSTSFHPSP